VRLPSLFLFAFAPTAGMSADTALAHSGGLNAEGCHNNRKTGDYHCHRGGSSSTSSKSDGAKPKRTGTAFRNCSAARAAGAAPVGRGDAEYGPHLDRDNDGVGCE